MKGHFEFSFAFMIAFTFCGPVRAETVPNLEEPVCYFILPRQYVIPNPNFHSESPEFFGVSLGEAFIQCTDAGQTVENCAYFANHNQENMGYDCGTLDLSEKYISDLKRYYAAQQATRDQVHQDEQQRLDAYEKKHPYTGPMSSGL